MNKVRSIARNIIFLFVIALALVVAPKMCVNAGEKLSKYTTDYKIKIEGTDRIPPGQYGYFEITNEEAIKQQYGDDIKYQWYVTHATVVDSYGWYPVDDDVEWLFDGNTKRLEIHLNPEYKYEDESKTYFVCCMITCSNGTKVISPKKQILTSEGKMVKQIDVVEKNGNFPSYGKIISFDYVKENTEFPTLYDIGKRDNNGQVDSNQGVQWFKWDEAKNEWIPKPPGAFFEEGSYRLKINICATWDYVFDPGLLNGTKCFIDNQNVQDKEYTPYNYSELTLSRIYNVKKDDNPRMMTLKKAVDFYESKSSSYPSATIPAGVLIKILDFSDEWIQITDTEGKTGWVKSSDIFDSMEHHWYVCTVNALNVRKTPEKTGERVASLKYGDLVYVEQSTNGFMQVKLSKEESVLGWVNSLYLKASPEKPYALPPKEATVNSNVGALTVRSDAGKSNPRIGGLPGGYKILVTGRKTDAEGKGWLIFDYNRVLGYVAEEFLSGGEFESSAKKSLLSHIPVGVPTDISTMPVKFIFTPFSQSVININDVKIDYYQKDIVYFKVTPEDGYSFPSDVSQIKFDFGADPKFKLMKIERCSDGSIIVYLKELDYCKKHGHVPATSFTVDKEATIDRVGSKSKHCVKCGQKCSVTVIPRISSLTIYKGKKVKLASSARASKWKTSNKKYVTVSSTGVLRGKAKGKAVIKATIKGKTYTCKVTVKPCSIRLNRTKLQIQKGKTYQLVAKPTPSGKVTFTSTKKSVATVSKDGLVKAKKKGKCQIIVKANGVRKKVTIIVK